MNIENNAVGGAGVGTSGFNVIAGSKSVGALAGTGTTSVSAGATLVADYIRQDSLTLEGAVEVRSHGSNASIVNTLSINTVAGGRLDLGDKDMIVHSASVGTSVGSTYDGLSGLIQSGSNGGSWDGSGILTSRPDAATGLTSLGIATGAQTLGLAGGETGTWNGMAVSGADALVMYTYRGDANLDGFISGDDYSAIDFASATPGAFGWHNGDFNWDGIISGMTTRRSTSTSSRRVRRFRRPAVRQEPWRRSARCRSRRRGCGWGAHRPGRGRFSGDADPFVVDAPCGKRF